MKPRVIIINTLLTVLLGALLGCGGPGYTGPRRDGGWIAADGGVPAPDGGPVDDGGPVLYLNFSGAALEGNFWDDAPANKTSVGDTKVKFIPPFDADEFIDADYPTRDDAIADITRQVRELYQPFDLRVVNRRPASGRFTMIVIGGTPNDFNDERGCSILGLATLDCKNNNHSNVGFAASACLYGQIWDPDDARRQIARTISHEAGHNFGLAHSANSGSIMDYMSGMSLQWGSGSIREGTDALHSCGRVYQDDVEVLNRNLGPRVNRDPVPGPPDQSAPRLIAMQPEEGDVIPPGIKPCIKVEDDSDVRMAMLEITATIPDSLYKHRVHKYELRSPPFIFEAHNLNYDPALTITYRFSVIDRWDNLLVRRAVVRFDPLAPEPSGCYE